MYNNSMNSFNGNSGISPDNNNVFNQASPNNSNNTFRGFTPLSRNNMNMMQMGNMNNMPNMNNIGNQSRLQSKMLNIEEQKKEIENEVKNNYIAPTPEEQIIIDRIVRNTSDRFANEIAEKGESNEVKEAMKEFIREQAELLPDTFSYESKQKIIKIAIDTTGLGPLEILLKDPTISEIVVQKYNEIFIERNGKVESVNVKFNNEEHLVNVINKIVGSKNRVLNLMSPIVDARLDDGSRVNATIPPVTPDGATLCIRKFSEDKLTYKDYLNYKSLTMPMVEFLKTAVEGKCNIFISGGTGAGKTSLLNMLSNYIPKHELIVTIEDTLELQLQSERVRRMETRVTRDDSAMMNIDFAACVKNALRMRPDRIIVGEIRDGAIVDMLSALSTGHDGGLTTGHANSPENLINTRLPILYGMNKDMQISEKAQKIQFSEAIQLIVQINRFPDGSRKIVEITAVDGIDKNGNVILNPIFVYDEPNNRFIATGYIPEKIINKCSIYKVNMNMELFKVEDTQENKKENYNNTYNNHSKNNINSNVNKNNNNANNKEVNSFNNKKNTNLNNDNKNDNKKTDENDINLEKITKNLGNVSDKDFAPLLNQNGAGTQIYGTSGRNTNMMDFDI